MRTQNTSSGLVPNLSTTALVDQLDDAALRSGHALLDSVRVCDFASWIDGQLAQLDVQFERFQTRSSVRKSFGR